MAVFKVEVVVIEARSNIGRFRYVAQLPIRKLEDKLYMSEAYDTPEEAVVDLFTRLMALPGQCRPKILFPEETAPS